MGIEADSLVKSAYIWFNKEMIENPVYKILKLMRYIFFCFREQGIGNRE